MTLGVLTASGNAQSFVTDQPTATSTIALTNTQAATIYFKNSGTPTPPPSTGCTYTHGWYKNQGNSTVPTTPFFGPGGNAAQ